MLHHVRAKYACKRVIGIRKRFADIEIVDAAEDTLAVLLVTLVR
jgi:hypothetical protein